MSTTYAVLVASASLLGADPAQDQVIARIRAHFERIQSIHVRGVARGVVAGGLWEENPATARPVYKNTYVREFDYWVDPPKQYRRMSEKRFNPDGSVKSVKDGATYFDGETYTNLNLIDRTGLRMKGGALVRPVPQGPLQAIGYCYPDTFHTSLAVLLSDTTKITLTAQPRVEGEAQWLIRTKPIPNEVRPLELTEKARSLIEVYLWVSVEPEVIVHKWGQYLPRGVSALEDELLGKKVPSLHRDGLNLAYGYVNCYGPAANKNEPRQGHSPMPTRVLHGNGRFTIESEIKELAINPKPGRKTFLPDIPPGFSLTRSDGTTAIERIVTGGDKGSAARVREISQEARTMLASGDRLRASPSGPWWTGVLFAIPIALGGAVVFFWLQRRKTT